MRTALDGDGLMDDVTLDACGRCEADLEAAYTAYDATVHHNIIGNHFAFDRSGLTDGAKVRADVALNSAFDLNVAGCLHVACDM